MHALRPLNTLLAILLLTAIGRAAAQDIEVTLGSYTITPQHITLRLGQPATLHLRNSASFVPHNIVVHAPEAGIDFKVDVSAGQRANISFTPTQAGRYEMICDKKPPFGKSHRERGMHGVIEVVP